MASEVKPTKAPEDVVNHPNHYNHMPMETIETIKSAFKGWYGDNWKIAFEAYCWGNELKYRLRAGLKGDCQQDIDKAEKYKEFRNNM